MITERQIAQAVVILAGLIFTWAMVRAVVHAIVRMGW